MRSGIFKDFVKTMKSLSNALDIYIEDNEIKERIKSCISNNWLKISALGVKPTPNPPLQIERITIPFAEWLPELTKKYDDLYDVVKQNLTQSLGFTGV